MVAIKVALFAVLFAGLGTPLLKVGQLAGVNSGQVLIINGFSSAIIGLLSYKFIGYPDNNFSLTGFSVIFLATLILNVGFVLSNYSYSLAGGYASIIPVIISAVPVISVPIGLFILKEADNILIPRLILGMLLILSGLAIVSTSIK